MAVDGDWLVKDSSLNGQLANTLTIKVPHTVEEQLRFRVQYEQMVPQAKILSLAGLRTKTFPEYLRFGGWSKVDNRTIEFTAIVSGFSLLHEIECNVLVSQDPVQTHFGKLPLLVEEVLPDPSELPKEMYEIRDYDPSPPVYYISPGDHVLGVRWQRLYEEVPARSFFVGNTSSDPGRQFDEALEPIDKRFPDTAVIESFREFADKTGVAINLRGLRQECNYHLVVGYRSMRGGLVSDVVHLSTKAQF